METEKKKRGRPLKKRLTETMGLTAEGAINYALDREVKSELDKALANKPDSQLTDEERKYLEMQRENKTRTLNIRFTESEYQSIVEKCKEYGYKKKSEYIRDCVRARVPSVVQQADLSETNRLLKAVGNNINQIAVRFSPPRRFPQNFSLSISEKNSIGGGQVISYEPFFNWYDTNGSSTYKLIKNHKISASLIQRMRENKPISTRSIDKLCKALDMSVDYIIEYVPDEETKAE